MLYHHVSCRKTIIDQHEKEIRYLQDVFMAMEQNYVDSEYESKLEFQSMWDDLKNKVQAEDGGTGSGETGRDENCSGHSEPDERSRANSQ